MLPTLKPDQQILVSSLPYLFTNPGIGDIIAFKSQNKFIVKRITGIDAGKIKAEGDNKSDSEDYGLINKSQILGKVIYIFNS